MSFKQKSKVTVSASQQIFTEEDLNTCKELVKLEAYPHLYGEECPKAIKFVEFRILDVNQINLSSLANGYSQVGARRGTKNPKFEEIQRHIRDFGFKLRNPPICVFRFPDGEYVYINGRTRSEILVSKYHFQNLIVAVYETVEGFSKDQRDDCISQFGIIANTDEDPSGPAQMTDVFEEVVTAIEKGWIPKPTSTEDDDPAIQAIRERISTLCGKGRFTQLKRDQIVFRVINQYDPVHDVLWFDHHKAVEWMNHNKYFNIPPKYDGIGPDAKCVDRGTMYKVISASAAHKGILDVVWLASQNPHSDIRVVLHTGTLDGYDLDYCYDHRVLDFTQFFNDTLLKFSQVFFNGMSPNMKQVSVYGSIPALGPRFDLTKLVLIKSGQTALTNSNGDVKVYYNRLAQSDRVSSKKTVSKVVKMKKAA